MIRRPPRSTQGVSSAASDVYKRQLYSRVSRSMAPPKFKAPTFPHFFHFFFALLAPLQQAFTIFCRIGGSVVEFSPATRETGVHSPPMHIRSGIVRVCRANYFMKFDVTYTGRRYLKGRGHPGFDRRPFNLQSKALPLSHIPVQVAPWLLQNSKHPHFPIFFSFFFRVSGCCPRSLYCPLSHW